MTTAVKIALDNIRAMYRAINVWHREGGSANINGQLTQTAGPPFNVGTRKKGQFPGGVDWKRKKEEIEEKGMERAREKGGEYKAGTWAQFFETQGNAPTEQHFTILLVSYFLNFLFRTLTRRDCHMAGALSIRFSDKDGNLDVGQIEAYVKKHKVVSYVTDKAEEGQEIPMIDVIDIVVDVINVCNKINKIAGFHSQRAVLDRGRDMPLITDVDLF